MKRSDTLPDCDELFARFFLPWMNEEVQARRTFKLTRPDMMRMPSLAGLSQAKASPLPADAQKEVLRQIGRMLKAVRGDWPGYLRVSGKLDLDWIDAFDGHYDRDEIAKVLARSDPADFSNDYLVICCELGAALGEILQSADRALLWHLDWPYWESALLDPKTGNLIPVFHWAVKKMSDYAVDDGLIGKIEACLKSLREDRKKSK